VNLYDGVYSKLIGDRDRESSGTFHLPSSCPSGIASCAPIWARRPERVVTTRFSILASFSTCCTTEENSWSAQLGNQSEACREQRKHKLQSKPNSYGSLFIDSNWFSLDAC
jgi:hypothetical protein